MKNTNITANLSRTFHKVGLQLKKHSPEILIVAGVIGTVTSAVMACKATTKVNTILSKAKEDIDIIHNAAEHPETLSEEYTVEDSKKDLAIVYTRTGVELFKLYAPAVALGAISLASIITSNGILHKRNASLAAAYALVDRGFKEYRGRVKERFGEAMDKELRFNVKAEEVEETIVDEKGKTKTVKKTVNKIDPNTKYSDYTRCFDAGCIGWEKDPEFNLMFIRHQQAYANDLLKSRGYLFLNEVYDMFGFPRTKAGQIVGWVYDENNPKGDNFVDFGIYNLNDQSAKDFINGWENSIWLDFNVQGNILDLI